MATIGVYPDLPLSFSWIGGRRFASAPVEPLVFEVYGDGGARMPAFFPPVIPLMHDELVAALRDTGVDNIDDYAAQVFVPHTGQTLFDYRAINIIGAVKAADLSRSEYVAPSGRPVVDVDFERLVIDEKATRGLLLFRLAEAVSGILVHERVRVALEPRSFAMLAFRPISEVVL